MWRIQHRGGAGAASAQALVAGDSLSGLTANQQATFDAGKEAFSAVETAADGLGPAFNERGCASCHGLGGTGGAGTQLEVRAGVALPDGGFDSLEGQGGQLFQLFGLGSEVPGCTFTGETVPAQANVTAQRRTTSLLGLGLVDATPDATFVALAASQPVATRGRVNMVSNISAGHDTVGKFGWKAQVPTLFQFSGDAYLNEMGITNPEFPAENVPQGNPAFLAACDHVPEVEDARRMLSRERLDPLATG